MSSDKAALRRIVRERLAALPAASRAELDAEVIRRALPLLAGTNALVLAYAALADEVNLDVLIRMRLRERLPVCLPRVEREPHVMQACLVQSLDDAMEEGPFHIREPHASQPAVAPESFACILVPGRAFSPDGARVGRGGGYYDRYLPQTRALRVGIAYEEQIFAEVPSVAHDARLDCIVTPERVIVCHPGNLPAISVSDGRD